MMGPTEGLLFMLVCVAGLIVLIAALAFVGLGVITQCRPESAKQTPQTLRQLPRAG